MGGETPSPLFLITKDQTIKAVQHHSVCYVKADHGHRLSRYGLHPPLFHPVNSCAKTMELQSLQLPYLRDAVRPVSVLSNGVGKNKFVVLV